VRSRASLALAIALASLGLAACGHRGTAGLTGNGQVPGTSQSVIFDCDGHPNVAPVTIVLSCSDGNALVQHLHWRSWQRDGAVGTGTFSSNSCQPNCAAQNFTTEVVTVAAGAAVPLQGHQAFSLLTVHFSQTGPNGQPSEVFQL